MVKPLSILKTLCVMITEQDENSPYPVTLPENVKLLTQPATSD